MFYRGTQSEFPEKSKPCARMGREAMGLCEGDRQAAKREHLLLTSIERSPMRERSIWHVCNIHPRWSPVSSCLPSLMPEHTPASPFHRFRAGSGRLVQPSAYRGTKLEVRRCTVS